MILCITNIIQRLERLKVQQSNPLFWLKSIDALIIALKELDSIVEMKAAKEAICLQLEYIIVKKSLDEETTEIFDDHMLHTVISGPPGVGKTHLGKSLAKIWHALGILKGKRPHPEVPERIYRSFTIQYDAKVLSTNLQIARVAKDLDVPIRKISKHIDYINPDAGSIHKSLKKQQSDLQNIIAHNQAPVIMPLNQGEEFPFKVATRADFVGQYVGQTAPRTIALLNSCIGGVLFIDEAYCLINGDRDTFGMEALTELNRFMSEHPNEIIIIFAGYKNLLDETIFRSQPGLKRRCTWTFEIESYTGEGLSCIFIHQLGIYGWSVHPDINLVKFFNKHLKSFPNFGGDTNRLIFYCKLYHMHDCFINFADEEPVKVGQKRKQPSKEDSKVITEKILLIGLEKFLENKASKVKDEPPFGMYL